eukprot:3894578-Prymnesium_polylepis.1
MHCSWVGLCIAAGLATAVGVDPGPSYTNAQWVVLCCTNNADCVRMRHVRQSAADDCVRCVRCV